MNPRRRAPRVRRFAAAIVVLALAFGAGVLGACAHEPRSSARSGADQPCVVTGTVVDAASGAPVAQARIRGPRDTRATSDEKGRFELRGLEVGDAGEVEATTEDRRTGRVTLRKLRGGPLEVVVHVAPPQRER